MRNKMMMMTIETCILVQTTNACPLWIGTMVMTLNDL